MVLTAIVGKEDKAALLAALGSRWGRLTAFADLSPGARIAARWFSDWSGR